MLSSGGAVGVERRLKKVESVAEWTVCATQATTRSSSDLDHDASPNHQERVQHTTTMNRTGTPTHDVFMLE
jgi:hypothetical protein